MRLIDGDKLHLKLLDMDFPIQDQDPILDAMDDCMVDQMPNDPLTLEQLQEMDGEPVWTVTIGLEGSGRWELCSCEVVTACPLHKVLCCVTSTGEATDYEFETYGKTWIAYRRRLEDSPVSQRSSMK